MITDLFSFIHLEKKSKRMSCRRRYKIERKVKCLELAYYERKQPQYLDPFR